MPASTAPVSTTSGDLPVVTQQHCQPDRTGEEGYNLVVLMVIITVMSVALSLALPLWSSQAKREKERELVFRGLQYAEAVRVFQARHGRLPTTLEELVEVEPRSIRQLFPDPMSENGKWGLLVQSQTPGGGRGGRGRGGNAQGQPGAQQPGQNGQQQSQGGQDQSDQDQGSSGGAGINPALSGAPAGRMSVVKMPPGKGTEEGFGRRDRVTAGPIVGVYSAVDEESMMIWNGQSNYQDWEFRVDIIPTPAVLGGDNPVPRSNSSLIGRPWPEGVTPQGAGNNVTGGQNLTGSGNRNRQGGRGDRDDSRRGSGSRTGERNNP